MEIKEEKDKNSKQTKKREKPVKYLWNLLIVTGLLIACSIIMLLLLYYCKISKSSAKQYILGFILKLIENMPRWINHTFQKTIS